MQHNQISLDDFVGYFIQWNLFGHLKGFMDGLDQS